MPGALAIPATGYAYKSISASTLIKTGNGTLVMVLITSSTDLTIKIWDNTSAATTVITATMAVDAKEQYDIPAQFDTGLYIEFVSGSGSLTVFWA
jgi:hypothetical protein